VSWRIVEADLQPIATGAAVLGTGGGGNPYVGMLRVRELLRRGLTVQVLDPDELADDALLVTSGGMGSPVVSYEKLPQGEEEAEAARALEEHLGRRIDAVAPLEMGGQNSLVALAVGALLGVPVLDGDGMGRAFPELQMVTYLIYGGSPAPAAVADEKGSRVVFARVPDARTLEGLARAATIEMGGHAGLAMCVMEGAHARATCVPRTLTLAKRIGEAIAAAHAAGSDPVEATLATAGGGRRLFRGKIVDVERRTTRGFARGRVTLESLDGGGSLEVEFQNENLIARRVGGAALAVVPDLITLVDADSGEPITTELLRYGFRVEVLVLPPSPVLTTPEALAVVGPRAFGYDLDYATSPG
jgi:hypothetical protein